MRMKRFAVRIALIAGLLLFFSAGPVSQKDAKAYCFYPHSLYKEYYVLIQCDGEGCEPEKSVVGWEFWDCDGTYYHEGNNTCGGLVRCSSQLGYCDPICE